MSQEKPRLTGSNLAAVLITAIIGLVGLGLMAMHAGIDGAVFAGIIAGVVGIAAGAGGFTIGRK